MSDNHDILDSALPEHPQKRDLLGHFCFYFHFAAMIYIILGWLVPSQWALYFYLAFLPLVFLQWQVNQQTCVLNNVETLLRTGRWRNPKNPEEGAWLVTWVNGVTGLNLSVWQMNIVIYAVLLGVWLLGLRHLRQF